jgi:hypothetical protein
MTDAYVRYPKLEGSQLTKLQRLEQDLGVVVVAVEMQAKVADLPPDKLRRLQEAEHEMGFVLVAYEKM